MFIFVVGIICVASVVIIVRFGVGLWCVWGCCCLVGFRI